MRFRFNFGGDPPRRRKKERAFRGRKVTFHGAFSSKADAVAKEKSTPGAYIRKVKGRYRVETRN